MLVSLHVLIYCGNAITKLLMLLIIQTQVCLCFQLLTWPSDQVVHLDTTFSLSCNFSSPPHRLTWLFDSSPAILSSGDLLSPDNSSLSRLASADTAGYYQCVAQFQLGTLVSIPALIQIGYIRTSVDSQIEVSGIAGSWLLLSCGEVQSLPQPQRLWLRQGLVERPVRTDSSVHQLVNGSLLFSNLSSSHAGVYICQANNPSIQQFRRVQYSLSISAGSTVAAPLHILLHTSLLISTGATAIFQCFVDSSHPLSPLSWLHNGVGISPGGGGYSISDDGSTLAISEAVTTHSGEYACAVEGLTSLTAILSVLAPPVLTRSDSASVVELGAGFSISCGLERGAPRTEFSWLRNGVPVNRTALVSLSEGNLSVSQSLETDEGLYQCIAANPVGRDVVAFRVEVISYPPIFLIHQSNTILIYFARSPLLINCSASSAPSPSFSWRKDLQIIDSSNDGAFSFSEPSESVLRKDLLSTGDSGNYSCTALNPLGSIQRSTYIRVIPGVLRFMREPSSHNFSSQGINLLVCEASVDSSLSLSFSWFFNGNKLQTSERVSYLSPGSGTLRFSPTQPSDAGLYQCRVEARDEIGSNQVIDNSLYSREVSIEVLNVPAAPSQLVSTDVTNLSISLTWTPSVSSFPLYNIHLSIRSSDGSLIVAGTYFARSSSIYLGSLLPYTQYLMQVSAENSVGVGPRSEPPLYVLTQIGVPTASPSGLSSHQVKAQSLILKWSAPPERSSDQTGRNGEVIRYEITYSSEEGSAMQVHSFNTPTNLTEYTLTALTPYTLYRVSVVALGSIGRSPPSPGILTRTLASEPNVGPQHLICIAGSLTSIACKVTLPGSADRNGLIDGFKVNYREANESVWSIEYVMEYSLLSHLGDIREFELKGLYNNSTYHLNVSLINIVEGVFRASPPSQIYIVPLENPVPGPPTDLKLFNLTHNSILANWSLPSRLNGPLTGYLLRLKLVSTQRSLASLTLNTSTTKYLFEGLAPDSDYSVSIASLSEGRQGFELETRIALPPGPPPPPVLSSHLTGSTLYLIWNTRATGGSPIVGYRIQFSSDGVDWSQLEMLGDSARNYRTSSLPAGTFRIRVVAVNLLGETASNEVVVTIPYSSILDQLSFQVGVGFGLFLVLLVLISCGGGAWIFFVWRRSRKRNMLKRSFNPNYIPTIKRRLSYLESTYDCTSDVTSHEEINPQYLTEEDRIVGGPDLSTMELEPGELSHGINFTPPYNLQPHILHLSPSLSSLQKPSQDDFLPIWNKPALSIPPIHEFSSGPESRDYVDMKGLTKAVDEGAAHSDSSAASAEQFTPPHPYQLRTPHEMYSNLRAEPNLALTPITPASNFLLLSPQGQILPSPQTFVSMSDWSLSTTETDPRCQTFV